MVSCCVSLDINRIALESTSGDGSTIVTWNTTTTPKSIFHTISATEPRPMTELNDHAEDAVVYFGIKKVLFAFFQITFWYTTLTNTHRTTEFRIKREQIQIFEGSL
jgi:hypothetical protein